MVKNVLGTLAEKLRDKLQKRKMRKYDALAAKLYGPKGYEAAVAAEQKDSPAPLKKMKTWWERFLVDHPGSRIILTSRGGPNMPRFQPCPDHGTWGKRSQKFMGGAEYYCRQCKSTFFVRSV
ncbi:MAG: hypothetical protein ACYDHZ_00610 [Dehalococcoidia bacterium]